MTCTFIRQPPFHINHLGQFQRWLSYTGFTVLISASLTDSLQKLIQKTMVLWAEETFISSPDLVREMFSLLHRQYDGIGEVRNFFKIVPLIWNLSQGILCNVSATSTLGNVEHWLLWRVTQYRHQDDHSHCFKFGCYDERNIKKHRINSFINYLSYFNGTWIKDSKQLRDNAYDNWLPLCLSVCLSVIMTLFLSLKSLNHMITQTIKNLKFSKLRRETILLIRKLL